MASSQNPGDPTYRRSLGEGGLVLRWSTTEDKAGCVLLSCLAVQEPEGQESERAFRYFEPSMDDAFHAGSSTNWAVCVDTSPIQKSQTPTSSNSDSYVDKMRLVAQSAKERVVAIVYFLPAEFALDQDTVRLPVGYALIVACKPAYRGASGGENIVDRLFEMVNARAHTAGCALMVTSGIPGYYRTQGYEYALDMGRGLVTYLSPPNPNVPTNTPSSFALRPATLDDLPVLERLVTAPRAGAEIFVGVRESARPRQLRHLLGDRPAAYPSDTHPTYPWFVLEKRDTPEAPPRVVAAAGLRTQKLGVRPTVPRVHPLLWDGVEDASAVAQAITREIVREVEAQLAANGSPDRPANIRWALPDAHPLYRWLLAHELAVPTPGSSRYDFMSAWWVSIPSLSTFLAALTPALNARLAGSKHIFGSNYTATLHIAASKTMGGGVVLRVADGTVSLAPANAAKDGKPNLSLPRGPLVQLMVGYAGWRELKALFPDVAVEPAVVPLVDVLFPKRNVWSGMYF